MRIVVCAVMAMMTMPVAAQVRSAEGASTLYATSADLQLMYRYQLTRLREHMLKQASADGGTLSPANRDRFQARLDTLNADFRARARTANSQSVDAMGSATTR